jgi:hypothetical protein
MRWSETRYDAPKESYVHPMSIEASRDGQRCAMRLQTTHTHRLKAGGVMRRSETLHETPNEHTHELKAGGGHGTVRNAP